MKSPPTHRSTSTGLTLLEMLICLAILALTTAVALPQATHTLAQQRIRQHMLLLHTQLAMARSTAITKSTPVSLCASQDGALCQLDGDWSSGRLMYLDRSRTAHPKLQTDILLATAADTLPAGATIKTSHNRRRIRFQPDGRSAGSNATFYFCYAGRLQGKVVVNNLGRTRSERATRPQPCT